MKEKTSQLQMDIELLSNSLDSFAEEGKNDVNKILEISKEIDRLIIEHNSQSVA